MERAMVLHKKICPEKMLALSQKMDGKYFFVSLVRGNLSVRVVK